MRVMIGRWSRGGVAPPTWDTEVVPKKPYKPCFVRSTTTNR